MIFSHTFDITDLRIFPSIIISHFGAVFPSDITITKIVIFKKSSYFLRLSVPKETTDTQGEKITATTKS